ncbi:MAG: ATP-binding cassette domain-containing protein [Clostridia bacterium]|nr:ATP-binding cassette domain-containing protein [Clostridia bacterium]
MAGLLLKDVNKIYPGGEHAVKNCNLEVGSGDLLVLTGPENCGKTSLLRMIAGLEEITSGELVLDGKVATEASLKERDVAMLFAGQSITPHLSVFDNLAYPLKIRKMPQELIEQKVNAVAEILGLTEYLSRKSKVLTGIQRQRVALGRIIVREPKVVLLDEPLAHLDANLRALMKSEIAKLHARLDMVFIYATHDAVEAMTMGTRIAVMKDGVIHQIDTPQNIYDHPADFFVADFIGSPSMNFLGVTLTEEEGKNFIYLRGGKKIELGKAVTANVKNISDYENTDKNITLGIRPEDVRTDKAFLASAQTVFKAKVYRTESLGSKTLISCEIDEFNFVDALVPSASVNEGDEIELAFDTAHIHLFDTESDLSLKA